MNECKVDNVVVFCDEIIGADIKTVHCGCMFSDDVCYKRGGLSVFCRCLMFDIIGIVI